MFDRVGTHPNPKGWLQYAGACYIIPIKGNGASDLVQLKIFDDAETDCTNRGPDGHLAIITNRYQQAFLSAMMYRTNLFSRPYIGVLGAPNDRTFYYSDNDRLVFSNWEGKSPKMSPEERRCVVMNWHPQERGQG